MNLKRPCANAMFVQPVQHLHVGSTTNTGGIVFRSFFSCIATIIAMSAWRCSGCRIFDLLGSMCQWCCVQTKVI